MAEEPSFDEMYDSTFARQIKNQKGMGAASSVLGKMPKSQTATARLQDWSYEKTALSAQKKSEAPPLSELDTRGLYATIPAYSHVQPGPAVRGQFYGQSSDDHTRFLRSAYSLASGNARSGPAAALSMMRDGGGSSTYGNLL
jgi:Rod binding domain-containing protein